ncbi:amino acid permease [Hortaea werneckii]|nr:amino acid permease [Hortaea werneckii]KAI7577987.1 amino acid permease [Hortaea werneckii]
MIELKNYGDKAVAEPVPSTATLEVGSTAPIDAGSGHLQRKLNAKQVQLYGIGTAIGTSVFVAMGSYLPTGGPAGLLMAFCIWSCVAFCINETYAEMVCYAPVPAPFVRFCSDWVDQALGFAVSWSFLLTSLFLIPFEITAFHKLIGFWGDFPVPATVFIVMALYGKVVLMFFLFAFVLVTMCGGNPLSDAYGFRYWSDPGAFAEYLVDGVSGRFLGFLSCLTYATFTVCGFEYVSLVAAETKTPRRILPAAYKSYPFRLLFFFCGAALAMGICIPYNDETVNAIVSGEQAGSGTGAASPYVIAMERLNISGLPHFVNAIIMTSVFSAGNGYVFAASRTLYTMAEQGRAPKLFTRTIRSGIPIYAVCACLSFSLLALLNVSDNTTDVMGYFVSLVTTNQLLNYTATCVTYIHFYHALKKQGISRNDLPYKGRLQPYSAYIGMVATTVMILLLGFSVFFPGQWSVKWFFLNYTFVAVFPIAFIAWKVVNKTTYQRLGTADLTLGGDVLEIDDYEKHADMEPLKGLSGWMERIFRGVRERKEIVD